MILNKLFFTGITALSVAACQPIAKKIDLASTFKADEAAYVLEEGDNTIIGNAFLRQNGGGVVTCAGYEAGLLPVTAYASERINIIYGNTQKGYASIAPYQMKHYDFGVTPSGYGEYKRKTVCDSSGNFKFTNVPDGDYFLTTSVIWKVQSQQGGHLMQRVAVSGGETKDLIVTQ